MTDIIRVLECLAADARTIRTEIRDGLEHNAKERFKAAEDMSTALINYIDLEIEKRRSYDTNS